jgi:hypothetical protein
MPEGGPRLASCPAWLQNGVGDGLIFKCDGSLKAVLRIGIRIRIHRIHMFLGLQDPDPDPLVRGMDPDPDPSIFMQK